MAGHSSPPGRALVAGQPPARSRLVALLRREGYEAVEAGDAAAVLSALAAEPVAVAVLDADLPGLPTGGNAPGRRYDAPRAVWPGPRGIVPPGGLAVLDEIRRREPRPPVVVFTETVSVRRAQEAAARGADDYWTLLLDDDDLARALRRVLPSRSARLPAPPGLHTLGRVACGMTHNLNDLLTTVLGYSELLLDGTPPDYAGRQHLELLGQAAGRAAMLTRQLLSCCPNRAPRLEVLDLNAVITNLDGLLRLLVGRDVVLGLDLQPGGARVRLEPGQLERVLMNLVLNSRDAMPHGGQLNIETALVFRDDPAGWHPAVPPGPYVMLTVRDTGNGLDADRQEHLFEPSFLTSQPEQGTGLGLAIVWEIVQGSGGTLRVESEPGRGTTFRVCFPQVQTSAAASPAVA